MVVVGVDGLWWVRVLMVDFVLMLPWWVWMEKKRLNK
jgi:hypothetical protein